LNSFRLVNSRIIVPGGIETGKTVAVEEGIISAVTDKKEELSKFRSLPKIDGEGCYLSPGFVELHIHGCGNASVDAAIHDKSVLSRMTDDLAEFGINTFVPTLMSNPPLISALAGQMDADPRLKKVIPGLYVEGPFVSPEKRGGILPEYVHPPDTAYLEEILQRGRDYISLMTVAPELEGMEEIMKTLDSRKVIPCFGHSLSTLSRAEEFLSAASKRNITHLFNAMSGFSHKEAGLAMLPFLDSRVYAELNGDGVHINDETLRLCSVHLDHEKLILISDAVVTAGLPYGSSMYYGREVVSNDRGVRYRENGILIGSNLLIPQVVKNFIELTGTSLEEALPMVTLNPCRLLGIDHRRGSIETGKEADLILLDENLQIRKNLFIPGQWNYSPRTP